MICKKCNTDNIIKAGYCKNCGTAFTQEERDAAFSATIYGKIDKVKDVWDKVTSIANLSVITDHIIVKYGLLVGIILVGLFTGRSHGDAMTILQGNDYSVQYNTELQEYYVLTQQDSVVLNLYLPKQAESIDIRRNTLDGGFISQEIVSADSEIVIPRDDSTVCTITAQYSGSSEEMVLYVVGQ